jgi:hypothetical protein
VAGGPAGGDEELAGADEELAGGFDEECDAAASGGDEELAGADDGGRFADAFGEAGLLEVPEPVHAETETETTTVKVAQAAK